MPRNSVLGKVDIRKVHISMDLTQTASGDRYFPLLPANNTTWYFSTSGLPGSSVIGVMPG